MMQHHCDRILLRQRMYDHLIAIDGHIGPPEMAQRRQHSDRGTVHDVALVVQHIHVDLQLPDPLVGHNAQRLQIHAVRVFEGALQNPGDLLPKA